MIDEQTIRQWWDVFKAPDCLTEIRILGDNRTFSGYYKDVDSIIRDIKQYDGYGIYATINAVKDACFSRKQCNRIIQRPKETTSGNDIEVRTIILVDLDPIRPSGTNSTDEEKARALTKAREIYKFLEERGFEKPVVCDSANGYHLSYKVRLANSPEAEVLVKNFLRVLDMLFSDSEEGGVSIDTAVFDPNRIAKLIGTTSNKGSDTPERPQRLSRILTVPDEFKETDISKIRAVASMLPEPEKPSRENNFAPHPVDVEGFLQKHGIEVLRQSRFEGGVKYILKECPFDHNHKDSAVFALNNGAAGFKCFHHSDSDKGWREFVLHYEPDYYNNRPMLAPQGLPKKPQQPVEPPKPEPEDDRGAKWLDPTEIERVNPAELDYIATGIAELDKAIFGLLKPGLSIMTGKAGSGKSTMLNQFILSARQQGRKAALFTGELPAWLIMSWLDQSAAGRDYVEPSRFGSDKYYSPKHISKKINEWLKGYLFIYNNDYGDKWSQLVSDITDCVRKNNVDIVIIDNLMALTLDSFVGEKNDKQTQFVKELKNISRRENIHIALVAHPRKEIGMQLLRMDSVAGTADLSNACDNLFIIHRGGNDFQKQAASFFGAPRANELAPYDVVLEIAKDRLFGKTDTLIGLYYEEKTRRILGSLDERDYVRYGWEDKPVQQSLDEFPDDNLPSPSYYEKF